MHIMTIRLLNSWLSREYIVHNHNLTIAAYFHSAMALLSLHRVATLDEICCCVSVWGVGCGLIIYMYISLYMICTRKTPRLRLRF